MSSPSFMKISIFLLLLLTPGICEQWIEAPGRQTVFYDRDSFKTHRNYQSVRMKHTLPVDDSKGMVFRQDVTFDYKQSRIADPFKIKPDGSLEKIPEHPRDKELDWQPIKSSKVQAYYKSIFSNK